ncbi:phosphohydrolase [Vibrio vulnificus]|uniref:phosphohydrolase n=1 Tax=Vibrio vulnificus TaxID=672 RepID=UPI001A354146|nr:phosphohydrolase [Vibrio vulnificus]EID0693323.1 phosphohydrolase [Vibrio vulnificus]EIU7058867.1 phosphohydrolase [Vibrio vulnificus]HAS8376332.1 phosphohydrolase [Vibrio vulnificus]
MSEENRTSTTKTVLCTSIITCLVFSILLLTLVVLIPPHTMLSYFGYANSVALANSGNINDPFTSHIVGELVKSGTLISLKDVWSFQTGFYQTIITFLIAINGLIAAVSVVYIKNSSEEKAEETTKRYMLSDSFKLIFNAKIKEEANAKLKVVQADFIEKTDKAAYYISTVQQLEDENRSLRQQIKIISERVAQLDTADSEGGNSKLSRKEQ